ncbi:bifunctional 4-hydroxy-2-oxoglutarate aldolase/2-dehydro-3-deoxy-phosphogluconate aldolase [Deinococcus peraridilitoris]|uniref:2-keto-3-deoxy-6-phosphogluconate aldolase n=1 Tax=Deinococcus peraridilitoris (strain DSM 19664 / LMG 22246 / CIP 109416 / KR-200) TaxID=937777 RepID=L0A6G2_DEIPD|nr:bifunctional 4-hydroxy-2-oxoglutarate aldolase/2-dehydro-3-deoxy-phosphogluconate aldolase [Deinococcus peraridilitoris]AFZ69473.1 2-keto-3-deoxy-6-phosphogluconate aldolase [Deinococcus peraridilitoris DSM 19664]
MLELIEQHRLIAILRGVPPQHAPKLAEHLHGAGVRLLEVALSDAFGVPALQAIQQHFGHDLHLGAGTITTPERAEAARQAGATYILTPHLIPDVNTYARQHQLGLISGATTPTEIQQARAQGSEVVKLFPAGNLGAGYVKSLLGPYPDLPILAVGAITEDNLQDFMKAGVVGVGLGSYLTSTDWSRPDYSLLQKRARRVLQQLHG